MLNNLVLQVFLILFFLASNEIIIRHDKPDSDYITFGKELSVTNAIVLYNSTDLAGTLISPKWILSAAHVAETIEDDQKLILNGESVGISQIIIHPEWQENGRPDLALIELENEVFGVEPVSLCKERDEVGRTVIVAGIGDFGTGITGVEGNPGTMRAATNRVDGSTSDGYYLYWLFDAPDSENSTELEGIAGPGDSSGPAFIKDGNRYSIAGISSAQSTRATGGKEGVYGVTEFYVRVSTFVEWIEKTISEP